MQSTRSPRPRSGRVRALLSLGMVIGITQVGTLAAWTDAATVESGSFITGTLDLQVGQDAADQLSGQGGSWQHTGLSLDNLAPGESVAQQITVGNSGSIPLAYTGSISTTDDTLSGADGLRVSIFDSAAASNAGTSAANDRVGTCTGGTATAIADTPVSTVATALTEAPVALASGATKTYCAVVTLSAAAPNTMQAASTTVLFSFEAAQ